MNRVEDPADPRRCKGATQTGQCCNIAVDGGAQCEIHGGSFSLAQQEAKRVYLLAQAKYRTRLAQLSEHEEVKSLRDEIAMARMLIEQRFNLINNDADLLSACGPINTMLLTVERLVKSAHSIEQNLGVLLARDTVLRLGQLMCEILVDELEGIEGYESIVDRITTRLTKTIAGTNNNLLQITKT